MNWSQVRANSGLIFRKFNATYFYCFIILALSTLVFRIEARFNPDAIHDGIMYPAALRVSLGGIPHKDAFSQYGPVAPLLQGIWLRLTDDSLLSLRYFSALFLSLTALTIFLALRLRIDIHFSAMLTMLWIFSFPRLLPATLPWTTIITTFLMTSSFVLLDGTFMNRKPLLHKFVAFGTGFMIGMSCFVRLQMLSFIIIFIAIELLYIFKFKEISIIRYWSAGVATSVLILVSYLFMSNSLGPFVKQTIVWGFLVVAARPNFFEFHRMASLFSSVFYILVGFYGLVGLYLLTRGRTENRLLKNVKLLFAFSSLVLVICAVNLDRINAGRSTFLNPLFDFKLFLTDYLQIFIYAIFLLGIYSLFQVVRRTNFERATQVERFGFALGLTAILQMYPSPDQLHLWWLTPAILIFTVDSLKSRIIDLWKNSWRRVTVLFVILIVLLCIGINNDQYTQRYHFKNSALIGMSGSSLEAPYLDKTMNLLEDYAMQGQVDVACNDGIFSGAGRKYLASSAYFLNIQSQVSLENWDGEFLFLCNVNRQDFQYLRAFPKGRVVFSVKGSSTWNVLIARRGE